MLAKPDQYSAAVVSVSVIASMPVAAGSELEALELLEDELELELELTLAELELLDDELEELELLEELLEAALEELLEDELELTALELAALLETADEDCTELLADDRAAEDCTLDTELLDAPGLFVVASPPPPPPQAASTAPNRATASVFCLCMIKSPICTYKKRAWHAMPVKD